MSYSGDSDTESDFETNLQQYKCHICNIKPSFNILVQMLEQIVENGPFLISLPNGHFYVRCRFEDCERYYHLHCLHDTFPDEALNFSHLSDLRENGIHCPKCEPGLVIVNY